MKHPLFTAFISFAAGISLSAQQTAGEKITYEDHIKPVLENKCFSCHNPDKKKGDLDLTSFAATMAGGGGGAVVDAGNGAGSRLITTTKKLEEPFMPPEGSPMPAKDIELLEKWINGGLLETKSSVAKKSTKPKVELNVAAGTGKPTGPIARPEHVLLEPVIVTPRTTAVTAMAASPWGPLVAFASPKQILLYDTEKQDLVGVFPYTEGYARSLRFSRSGSLLVMGGGKGGKFGHVVVWDVKTGRRITEVGKEMDCVMSADITPDHSKIVLGSPSKKVKVFDTATGEELYMISKHTEWVLVTAFSPDGVLLGTADRNGNVNVWEAANGGEFYILGQHKAAVTDLAWRSDANVLASCSEDGTIILWEMNEGKQLKSWAAHGGGVQSVDFTPDGKIVSAGRDGQIKLWDINGTKLAESPGQGDVTTKVVALYDSKSCVAANWRGEIKLLSLDKFSELGALTSNPSPIAQRIVETERMAADLTTKLPVVEGELKKAEEGVKAREAFLAETKKKIGEADAYRNKLNEEIKDFPNRVAALEKAVKDSQTKRQAQIEVLKKHEQTTAQVKEKDAAIAKLDGELAAVVAQAAQLTKPEQAPQKAEAEKKVGEKKTQIEALRSQLAPLKQAIATVPAPLTEFDKAIKDAQDLFAKFNADKPGKLKEQESLKKTAEGWPKTIADAEKQLADARAVVVAAQGQLERHRARLAFIQKQPTFLRAAQFNINVLAEKEKLTKLEGDFADLQGGLKEAEAAKAAALKRIEDSKKAIADATQAVPALDATLIRLKGELPNVEKILVPTKTQEGQVAAQVETHKKALAGKEAEVKGLEQEKANRIAAAQKAVGDINKQLEPLGKQRNDVAAKLAAPQKVSDAKKTELAAAEADLKTAQQQHAGATELLKQKAADAKAKEAAFAAAHQALDVAQKAAPPVRQQQQQAVGELNQKKGQLAQKEKELAAAQQANKPDQVASFQKVVEEFKVAVAVSGKKSADLNAQLAATEKASEEKRAADTAAKTALDAAKKAAGDAQVALNQATSAVQGKEQAVRARRGEFENAEKAAAPLRNQLANLDTQIAAQKKTLAEKQAEPGNAEKDFATKSQPVQAAIAQTKAALAPVEKQLADIRAKLAADTKTVEAKRAEVAKAQGDVDAARKRIADSQKTIEVSTKEVTDKDVAITETKAAIAKLEPQLPPMREKVKQLTDQYLAMLPK